MNSMKDGRVKELDEKRRTNKPNESWKDGRAIELKERREYE